MKMRIDKESRYYPEKLKEIYDPPKSLYIKGNPEILLAKKKVAIVGSRKHSAYGKQVALSLAKKLASNGITVVSGLALGIDALAHRGALEAGGNTIAVLGCGLDIDYPRKNAALRREVEKSGTVITEYEDGVRGTKFTFPRRNRIISGLCDATIVAEAGLKSGALITASIANEQGRMVYSVPGNINSIYSMGTNMLIRDGATPLMLADDVLRDLGVTGEVKEEELQDLGEDEKRIYSFIKEGGEVTLDAISSALSLRPQEAAALVTVMEMKGVLSTALGRVFLAK